MKFANFSFFPYRLPLTRPLPGDPTESRERHGYLVRVKLESGVTEWGDVAPLPGTSPESLDDTTEQLRALIPVLDALEPQFKEELWSGALLAPLADVPMCASVRFGIETAILNAASVEWQEPWHRRLTGLYRPHVYMNALLSGEREHMRIECHAIRAAGYRCVKIKVGSPDPAEDIERVRMVRELVGEDMLIRVDANRAWTLDAALEFAGGVDDLAIDYIEEPVRDTHDLTLMAEQGGLRIALDETILNLSDDDLKEFVWLHALVIKPTIQHGISGALGLSRLAYDIGAVPVISSTFESGVGLRALIQLASVLNESDTPVGLGTVNWLAGDVLANPMVPTARVSVDQAITFPTQVRLRP
ncbi:MAG: o-succinylbenzoate synthase [Verrucomicrobia bacterium]|nr:o-succinylbenzoate synthase [Verrucomicrobiota bacterium]